MTNQWEEHVQECKHLDLYDHKKAKQLKKLFQQFIIQCEDHEANKMCIYCPKMYLTLHEETLRDINVFKVHEITPSVLHEIILEQIPPQLRKTYKWGINTKASLPSSYIFPKKKKKYKKARPVITFYKTQLSKLWKAFGKLIYDMTRKVFFNTFHNKSTTQTFETLHEFLKKNKKILKQLVWHNDDIKGFFTAVPHADILSSFEFLVAKYIERFVQKNADMKDTWITVDYDQPAKRPRTIQGRAIKTKTSVRFRIIDIIPLVTLPTNKLIYMPGKGP